MVLSQPNGGKIEGFEHHIWNGVTTLQFAQLCEQIISNNIYNQLVQKFYVHHYVPNNTVNKYQLMHIFNDIFEKNLKINRVNKPEQKLDRSLATKYSNLDKIMEKKDMKTAISELKNYMINSD